jgi:hypothetical protein
MKRLACYALLLVIVGCTEGQKPNPLPRAKEQTQELPRAVPAETHDR